MIGIAAIEDHVGSYKAAVEFLLARIARYEDSDIRDGQEKRLRRYIEILDGMKRQADAIRTDVNLSEAGMATKLRNLAKTILDDFKPLFEAADSVERNYKDQCAQLSKVPEPAAGRSELATLLREQELRVWIRSLPLATCMMHYITAIHNGDTELVRAVRTAPGPALIPMEVMERVERERLGLNQRSTLERLESLDLLQKDLRGLAEMIRNWLKGYEEVKFPAAVIKQGQPYMASR